MVIGAVSGGKNKKKPGNSASRGVQDLLTEAAKRAKSYDPSSELSTALGQASSDTERAITRVGTNIFSQYANSQGSYSYLPDTARNSAIRGAMSDIGEKLATYDAEQRSNLFQKWLSPALAVVGSANAGRGGNAPRP